MKLGYNANYQSNSGHCALSRSPAPETERATPIMRRCVLGHRSGRRDDVKVRQALGAVAFPASNTHPHFGHFISVKLTREISAGGIGEAVALAPPTCRTVH